MTSSSANRSTARMSHLFISSDVFHVCLLILTADPFVLGFEIGAPPFACVDLDPGAGHGPSSANGPAPYQITFSKDDFTPGETIEVTLSGIGESKFKGFIIVGQSEAADSAEPLGYFSEDDAGQTQITCDEGTDGNGLTHTSPSVKSSLTFKWTAPSNEVGDIVFRYSVVRGGAPSTVRNPVDYFTKLVSAPLKENFDAIDSIVAEMDSEPTNEHITDSALAEMAPAPIGEQNTDSIQNQDATFTRDIRCGVKMSCLSNCQSDQCDWQIMFGPETGKIRIEMKSISADNNYIAFGLSHNKAMYPANVLSCQTQAGKASVLQSSNPGYRNALLKNPLESLSLITTSYQNGILHCTFLRDIASTNPLIYNASNPWFFIAARGALQPDNNLLMYHGNANRFLTLTKMSVENVTLDLRFPDSRKTTTAPPKKTTNPAQNGKFTRDSACGATMGCCNNCVKGLCDWQVMFAPEKDYIRFDLKSTFVADDRYLAFGFSDQSAMFPSSILACQVHDGKVTVVASNAFGHYISALKNPSEDISNVTGSYENGLLHCSFLRKKVSLNPLIYNLTESWNFIAARGTVNTDGSLSYHGQKERFKTEDKFSVENVTFDMQFPSTRASSTPSPVRTTSHVPTPTFAKDHACGRSKACVSDCDDGRCRYLHSWKKTGQNFTISLKGQVGDSDNKWLALGFSTQAQMGDASVVECTVHNGKANAYTSYNEGESNQRLQPNSQAGIYDISGSYKDGILSCTFTRVDNSANSKMYDLRKRWYLITAKGDVDSNGVKIPHKLKDAFYTKYKVDFADTSTDISLEEPSYLMVKLHGCFMIGAWILSASIGIAVARFFKPMCPDTTICGLKVWFAIHRAAMVLTFCLGAAAFIIIFVDVDGYSEIVGEDYKKAHPILGIIVTSLLVINPFMSLLRCKPDHPQRSVFNWAHFTVGTSAHILAAVTIAMGMYLPKAQVDGDHNLMVIIAYGAWQICFFVIMSLLDYCSTSYSKTFASLNDFLLRNNKKDKFLHPAMHLSYNTINSIKESSDLDKHYIIPTMNDDQMQMQDSKTKSNISGIKSCLLVLHITIITGIALYLMYTIIDTDVDQD